VDLDWWTDDHIAYEEEQTHESVEDIVVPDVAGLSTPAGHRFGRRGHR